MIREIINFTNDLLADIPEIINWNELPDKGIHIFIDINKKGEWTNRDLKRGIDFDYFGESATNSKLEEECIRFQDTSRPIVMNKAIDTDKQIHSCSPFSVAYKMKWNGISKTEKEKFGILTFKKKDNPNEDEIRQNNEIFLRVRNQMIRDKVESYKKAALSKYHINDVILMPNKESFPYISQLNGFYSHMDEIMDVVETLPIKDYNLNNDDYVHIYLRTVPIEVQEKMYEKYVEENIFITEDLCIGNFGPIDFDTAYNSKKPLIRHLTSSLIGGVNQRFPKEDAVTMHKFEILCKNGTLPNPLPIVVDNSELNNNSKVNSSIVRLWNRNGEERSFRNLINDLFRSSKFTVLPDFYLLHLAPTSNGSFVADDFDFVPLFRYDMPKDCCIYNATGIKSGFWSKEYINIKTIFDFERIIIREIFNNKLVNITKDEYKSYYFGKIKLPPCGISGGLNIILDLIFRYRKSIYDFIYKSDRKSITGIMFDNIMLQSILSNIKDDEVKYNYASIDYGIKVKLNIWFSLYNFFNQHINQPNMATRIPALLEKIRKISNGEEHISSPEELAFAAGQLASYLIDCSEAGKKTYAMLEPYLQKSKTTQVLDVIADRISMYKHKLRVSNAKFKKLASEVLTDDSDTSMKPLLKYFLAGCFCECVFHDENDHNNKDD